jgi:hypothetical protein
MVELYLFWGMDWQGLRLKCGPTKVLYGLISDLKHFVNIVTTLKNKGNGNKETTELKADEKTKTLTKEILLYSRFR